MKAISIAVIFLRLAKRVSIHLIVLFVLFFLPMDVLFRLSSWVLFMPAMDMVRDVSMMILLLALMSASLALLLTLASAGLALGVAGTAYALTGSAWFPQKVAAKIEDTVCALSAIGTLVLIVFAFLKLLKTWGEVALGITVPYIAEEPALFVLATGIFVGLGWKCGLVNAGNAIQSRLAKGSKGALILIVSAAMVVGVYEILLRDYREMKTDQVSSPRSGAPNVILISIDALTAEDMSLYGYHLPTTPKLEAFAKESYVFSNFFASSNWTTPSIASLVSGLYPDTHGVNHKLGYFLEGDRKRNLGQLLKDNGYQTAAFVANNNGLPLTLHISDSFSLAPMPSARRVILKDEMFDELYRLKSYFRSKYTRTYTWAMELLTPMLNTLSNEDLERTDDDPSWTPPPPFDRSLPIIATLKQPNFVWSHIFPPHDPYMPAAPFKYRFGTFKAFSTRKDYRDFIGGYPTEQQSRADQARLRFDEFILDTDSRVGEFLDKLRASGRFDDSIIIITADHGESFTKNYLTHGGPLLHQPLIHIPLLVHLPGQKDGKRISSYAGQVDLLPTVMDLLGLPIPKWVEGESLRTAMLQGKPTSLPKFSMNLDHDSRFTPPNKGTVAVMYEGWKLVRYLATGNEQLYHLEADPGEATDLASSNPKQAEKMRDLIYARFRSAE